VPTTKERLDALEEQMSQLGTELAALQAKVTDALRLLVDRITALQAQQANNTLTDGEVVDIKAQLAQLEADLNALLT